MLKGLSWILLIMGLMSLVYVNSLSGALFVVLIISQAGLTLKELKDL
jgi:cob(I)alamin adenosyltransferase